MSRLLVLPSIFLLLGAADPARDARVSVRVHGVVVDADTRQPLPCRLYVAGRGGGGPVWYFAASDGPPGSAVRYDKQVTGLPGTAEKHTTLSAHPFLVDLPPGQYTFTVERGKEYLPLSREITVGNEPPPRLSFEIKRLLDAQKLGWYSGDTHVHRGLAELPNIVLAEDLNVALPLTSWVTDAFAAPGADTGDIVAADATHVIYARNTEYEIGRVGTRPHELGAFFVLNHRSAPKLGVPPVGAVGKWAHREGALIDLDKHNWEWSMMLVPVLPVDLYELANNHLWRSDFTYRKWNQQPPAYMRAAGDEGGVTEQGWVDYGLQNYYALLNCGFRLRPTAGTASGVHPVPLGFGRVYVHLDHGFAYDAWMRGLDAGRSFVTTGPLLLVTIDRQDPGHVFKAGDGRPRAFAIEGRAVSPFPLKPIEVVVNGAIVRSITPENRALAGGGYESRIDEKLKLDASSYVAVRCFEDRPDRRVRFAHTAPFYYEVPAKPLRPRKVEVEYLVRRVAEDLARNSAVLAAPALAEYRAALAVYRKMMATAR